MSLRDSLRTPSLASLGLGAASFLLPHLGTLAITKVPPYFHRELTLWPTWVLLLTCAIVLSARARSVWRSVSLLFAGVVLGMILYILGTADRGSPQILGAVSRPFLWTLAIGLGAALAAAPILVGALLGTLLRRRPRAC